MVLETATLEWAMNALRALGDRVVLGNTVSTWALSNLGVHLTAIVTSLGIDGDQIVIANASKPAAPLQTKDA